MKKLISILACILLVLILLVPVFYAGCAMFGYSFSVTYPWVFVGVILALTAATVLISIFSHEELDGKFIPVVCSLLTPCVLINTAFYVRSCGTLWLVFSLLICIGCGYLTFRHGKPATVRAGAMVLSASLLLPMIFICFILLVAGRTQNNIVVNTVDSPNGKYYAQVINNDQGEMGGSTIVNVYAHSAMHNPVFHIEKKHQKIYVGEHDEYKTMIIQWKNDNCLVINATEYPVK